jgi:hypothetical protein
MAYERFPSWIPLLSVTQALTIYALGALLVGGFGPTAAFLYLLFCVWSEYRVMQMSCRHCCYFGKLCGTGKGIVAPLFTRRGDPSLFLAKAIGWKELIPDFLVFLIPVLAGLINLFFHFRFSTLGLIVLIVILALPGSGFMRTRLICANCRQRELGCPAEKLFGSKKKEGCSC